MLEEKFTVLHDDNAVFSDKSFEAKDYDGDSFGLVLIAAEDKLLVGLEKPFNAFYVEMKTANTNAGKFTAKYFDENDLAFKTLTIQDESKMFTRSGFLLWDKPKSLTDNNLWKATTIDGKKKFWLELTPSVDFSGGTDVQGLNIVLSDDNDLIRERGNIVSQHAVDLGLTSWILKHVSSREELLQRLRNSGNRKIKTENIDGEAITEIKDITVFDLHDFNQLRQASKLLTLAKIFIQELSDEKDDKFDSIGKKFQENSDAAFNLFFLSLDFNDDGVEDHEESLDEQRVELSFT